jgi:hypothetical protein
MAFRRDELMSFDLVLQGDRVPGVTLTLESAETIRTAASKRKLIKAASLRCGFFYPASFYASQFWQKLKCGAYCDLLDPTTVIFMATLMACAMSVVLYSAHLSFPKRFKACANGPWLVLLVIGAVLLACAKPRSCAVCECVINLGAGINIDRHRETL